MRGLLLTCLLASQLSILTACQRQAPNQPATQSQPAAAAASPSPWKMALTTNPNPPVSEKDTRFQLKLSDEGGKSVAGAQVKAELVMPSMDMGKNELSFADKGSGDYEAPGKFTMSGPWHVVVTATAQGKSGQQTFPIVVHVE